MLEYEKSLIVSLLQETNGNIREAAAKVDERRRVIYRILKRHGLNPNDFRMLGANPR